MNKSPDNLIWIDLEMTGLNPDTDKIIEIAVIVTDKNLNTLVEFPEIAIQQPDAILNSMDEWNTNQHNKSGLVERVKKSQYDEARAEQEVITFLEQYVPAGKSPMCGNSICQDRRFLFRYMPKLEKYFHYRHIDVSTLKELARRWKPSIMDGLEKESKHLALDDIKESIDELIYYREHFLDLMK